MSITQRTLKLVLATCFACLLAYFFDLSSAVSAGIIAILSLSDTRRSTIKLARNRLFSTLLALMIGVIQDSCETALNSSTDVLFTAVAEYASRKS